jgi:hypothetical protein
LQSSKTIRPLRKLQLPNSLPLYKNPHPSNSSTTPPTKSSTWVSVA